MLPFFQLFKKKKMSTSCYSFTNMKFIMLLQPDTDRPIGCTRKIAIKARGGKGCNIPEYKPA